MSRNASPKPTGPEAGAGVPVEPVRPGRLVSLDRDLLILVARLESALLTRVMRTFTRFGDVETWILVILVLAAVGGEATRYAFLMAVGASCATLVSQVFKRLACRPRPARRMPGFSPRIEVPDEFSFPSGHTSAAFAVVAALAGEPSGVTLLLLVVAVGIALSRIYLGAHYPLDVAAGVVLGTASGCLARLVVDVPLYLPAIRYTLAGS